MTSNKIKLDNVKPDIDMSSIYDTYISENLNRNRNLIALSIEVSKISGVPMMILGNPGEGKTTTIDDYAKQYGYHVEKLIGSQYSQDDVLGFQTNTGKEHLEVLIPNWYQNILDYEKEGVPSILFLDELVTASTEVQEALLQLTKERTIRDNKKLPDDTIVISAINYKDNLPPENNVTSTQLNRFCLINTLPGGDGEHNNSINALFVAECVQGFNTDEFEAKLPEFKRTPFTEEENKNFKNRFGKVLESILNKYSGLGDDDKGIIDLRNTNFDGMFEGRYSVPEVYNFISKRTVSYLLNVMRALCELGIHSNSKYWKPFIVGLIGLGTNNWSDDNEIYAKQLYGYHKELYKNLGGLLDTFSHSDISYSFNNEDNNKEKLDNLTRFDESTLSGMIKKLIADAAASKLSEEEIIKKLTEVLEKIDTIFPSPNDVENPNSNYNFIKAIKDSTKDTESSIKFRADFEAVKFLKESLSILLGMSNDYFITIYEESLEELLNKYEFYYITCQNGMKEKNL